MVIPITKTTANIYAHLDSNSKQISANALTDALKLTDTKKIEENKSSIPTKN